MTLITRKKMGQEAQMQRQEVRQLRELLTHRQQEREKQVNERDCGSASSSASRLQLVRRVS
jgi:hypothetical protein